MHGKSHPSPAATHNPAKVMELQSTLTTVLPDEAIVPDTIRETLVLRSCHALTNQPEFSSNLIIHCDLTDQQLTVAGDVHIRGSIKQCSIISQGQIRVDGVCESSSLFARGNVALTVVRGSDILSHQSVIVRREVRESSIQAIYSIFAATARVQASRLSACDTISLQRVLLHKERHTELELGDTFLRRKKESILYQNMVNDGRTALTMLEVLQAVQQATERDGQDAVHEPQLRRAERELERARHYARQSEERYRKYCTLWDDPQHYRIVIAADVAPGTIIRMEDQVLTEEHHRAQAEYVYQDAHIQACYELLRAEESGICA